MKKQFTLMLMAIGMIASAQIKTEKSRIPNNVVEAEIKKLDGIIEDSLKLHYEDEEYMQWIGHKIYHKKFERYATVLDVFKENSWDRWMQLKIEWDTPEQENKKKKKSKNRIQTISDVYASDYIFVPRFVAMTNMIGDDVYVVKRDNYNSKPIVDLISGEIIPDFNIRGWWKIVDVLTVKDRYNAMFLVLENGAGQQMYYLPDFNRASRYRGLAILTEAFYQDMEDTLTDRELTAVFERKIFVGMSEKALLLSWGKPDEINRSSYSDAQWVYDGQYVYVDRNGIITAWN